MADVFKRFGFAAVVTLLVLAMAVAVLGKSLFGKKEETAGGGVQTAGKASAPGSGKGKGKGGDAPVVVVGTVARQPFFDVVRAIGTAQARESIVVSAKVTDVIRSIRFESGDRVARGQVLVQLSSVEQAADLEEARASREAARRDYDRFKELGEKGFAPAQRVEAARAAFEQSEARVRAGESRIGDRTIRAPFAGVMGLRTASPGALVRPGDPIATLDDTSEIKLDFEVAESQIAQAAVGASIVASSTAQPGRVFEGRVADVDTRVNAQSRTLRIRALIPNRDGMLKPGMLMTVELRSNPRTGLAAPEVAVLERSDGSYLYTLEARDGRDVVVPVLVSTGRRSGGLVEIVSGVPEGTRIIVEGVQRARPNQPVRIVSPTTAPVVAAPAPTSAVAPSPPATRAKTLVAAPLQAKPQEAPLEARPPAAVPAAPDVATPAVAPTPVPADTSADLRGRVEAPAVAPPAPGGQSATSVAD